MKTYIIEIPKGCKEARFFCWNEKQGQYVICPAKEAVEVGQGSSNVIDTSGTYPKVKSDSSVKLYAVEDK